MYCSHGGGIRSLYLALISLQHLSFLCTFHFAPVLLSWQLFSLFTSILLLSAFLCPQVPIGGLFISCLPFHFSLQTLRPQPSAHFTLHTIHQPGTRSHMTPMLTYMSLSWETPRSRVECPALSVSTIFIDRGVTSTVASLHHGVIDVLQSRWWHPLTLTGAHLIAAPFVSLPYSSHGSYSHSFPSILFLSAFLCSTTCVEGRNLVQLTPAALYCTSYIRN